MLKKKEANFQTKCISAFFAPFKQDSISKTEKNKNGCKQKMTTTFLITYS